MHGRGVVRRDLPPVVSARCLYCGHSDAEHQGYALYPSCEVEACDCLVLDPVGGEAAWDEATWEFGGEVRPLVLCRPPRGEPEVELAGLPIEGLEQAARLLRIPFTIPLRLSWEQVSWLAALPPRCFAKRGTDAGADQG